MTKKSIYLAGPISGLTYEESAEGWRVKAKELLPEFDCYSPMRAKDFLRGHGKLFGGYDIHPMATEAGILGRDRNDLFNCNLVLANFLEASPGVVSIGTCMEFGWADARRTPIIMVAEEGDIHRAHPMLHASSTYVVDNLEQACELSRVLLLP